MSFSELRTDEASLSALQAAVAEDRTPFRADTVTEAVTQSLGSSIRVESGDES